MNNKIWTKKNISFWINHSDQPMQEHERKAWHPVVWQQPPPPVEEIKTGAVSLPNKQNKISENSLKYCFLSCIRIQRMHHTNESFAIFIVSIRKQKIIRKCARKSQKTCYWLYHLLRKPFDLCKYWCKIFPLIHM